MGIEMIKEDEVIDVNKIYIKTPSYRADDWYPQVYKLLTLKCKANGMSDSDISILIESFDDMGDQQELYLICRLGNAKFIVIEHRGLKVIRLLTIY